MKPNVRILIIMSCMALVACSNQEIKPDTSSTLASGKLPAIPGDSAQNSGQNPPLTLIKEDKTLDLVRIMDGGACKNDFQGAKGAFLIYADPVDIARIKREKGTQVFSDFESKIQTFSTAALQEAINATNLAEDPFALGADQAQEKLASLLSTNFQNSVANDVKLFQNTTSLTIAVAPFTPSFIFYQQGCAATQQAPEN